jgi:hypothetical protein
MTPLPDDTLHLTSADFDAYLPERATSNAHTEPRLALKLRMLAWARGVVARLAELGVPVEITASDEHPSLRNGRRVDSQRVYFCRDTAARWEIDRRLDKARSLAGPLGDPAPHQRHAFLQLRVDATKVEVSAEIHADAWVDAKNLRARLADPAQTLELTSALEALPEQFTIGFVGPGAEAARTPAARATSDSLRELVAQAGALGKGLWLGWSIPRDVAVAHSELLDEQLEDALAALGTIQKLVAWAADNDLLDLGRDRGSKPEMEPDDEGATHEARRARRERDPAAARALSRELANDASASVEPHDATPIAREAEEPARPPRRPEPVRAVPRLLSRKPMVTEVDPNAPIEKGTRVQVLSGPFRGKIGVVQDLEPGGIARVMLGLLATHVDTKDLIAAAEGKDRPALASSHRKPIGAR